MHEFRRWLVTGLAFGIGFSVGQIVVSGLTAMISHGRAKLP